MPFLALVLFLLLAPTAAAQDEGGSCLTADPPPPGEVQPLRFGITPRLAGSAGVTQEEPAAEDLGEEHRGARGAAPEAQEARPAPQPPLLVRRRRRASGRSAGSCATTRWPGFRSEIQVRYHPPDGHEGDIAGFEQFVATAVRRLGRRRAVVGFSITNEANLPISPNTSDGAYEGVVDALVRGVIVARRELRRLGRPRLDVGFNVMWRWNPDTDRQFWEDIGAHPDAARFRKAVDNVGRPGVPGPRLAARADTGPHGRRRDRRGADAGARLLHAEGGARARRRAVGERERLSRPTSAAARSPSGATSSRPSRPSRSGRARSASPTTAGSTCATTTPTGPTSSPRSACSATTTRASPRSTPTGARSGPTAADRRLARLNR